MSVLNKLGMPTAATTFPSEASSNAAPRMLTHSSSDYINTISNIIQQKSEFHYVGWMLRGMLYIVEVCCIHAILMLGHVAGHMQNAKAPALAFHSRES
jgi:hypothetical protein